MLAVENLDQILDAGSNSFWNLLLAAVVIGISLFAARHARRAVRKKLHQYEGVDENAGAMIARVTGWTIVLLGVVVALVVLGVDMVPVVLLILLVVAFLVLSARSLIENWAAGLLLQARAPYRPGDRIETLDFVGDVELTNLRSVVLRQPDGQIVHLPNVDVLKNPLTNKTGDQGGRRSALEFGVAGGTDLDATERILVESAASVPGVRSEPAPSAWVASLGDTAIVLELRFWHDYETRNTVRSAVAHEALARLDAAGVNMPFPTQEVIITGETDTASTDSTPTDTIES
jgi:small-conductance mechanosensitive channel